MTLYRAVMCIMTSLVGTNSSISPSTISICSHSPPSLFTLSLSLLLCFFLVESHSFFPTQWLYNWTCVLLYIHVVILLL